jgi:hypothetical protein
MTICEYAITRHVHILLEEEKVRDLEPGEEYFLEQAEPLILRLAEREREKEA